MNRVILHIAASPVCEAAVSTLPTTGGTAPVELVIVGALILVAGVVLVLLAARRSRSRMLSAALVAVGLLACGPILFPHTVTPASAATGQVDYSPGCTLIHVDQIVLAGEAAQLLPGDAATAIRAVVTNTSTAPITLSGAAILDGGTVPGGVLDLAVGFDGVPGPVALAAGQSIPVSVTVSLPSAADNSVQALSSPLLLTVTASLAPSLPAPVSDDIISNQQSWSHPAPMSLAARRVAP